MTQGIIITTNNIKVFSYWIQLMHKNPEKFYLHRLDSKIMIVSCLPISNPNELNRIYFPG